MTSTSMLSAGLVAAFAATGAAAEVESLDPIRLTTRDWTGQVVTTTIMGRVLEAAGYNVEYVQADYIAQFAGLKTGDLHVAMEVWKPPAARRWTRPPPRARSSTWARPA